MSDSVTEIEWGAFDNCPNLTSVRLSSNITKIPWTAFQNCVSLTSIQIPEKVTEIAENAFENCSALTSITIPANVTTIGKQAFYGCSSLRSVTFSGQLDTIAVQTFADCTSLTSVSIPYGVEYIASGAFKNCTSLTSVVLPETLKEIAADAFAGCSKSLTVYAPSGSAGESMANGMGFNYVQTEDTSLRFTDVKSGDYCYSAVYWAVENEITNGTTKTTFSPQKTCTVAQIITFLYRAERYPELKYPNAIYAGLSKNAYYTDAVMWAYENGLLTETDFNANALCTRAMAVTFFWKLWGEPVLPQLIDFEDVPADSPYNAAVSFAVAMGVTKGTTATTFSPDKTCTRGQIVTFLYRLEVGDLS